MAKILDQYGKPINTADLREPQTARAVQLQREYQNHPAKGLTPPKLASLLLEAEEGVLISQAELGLDMEERDAHLYAELCKRKLALVGLEWDIRPPRDASAREKADCAALKTLLEDSLDLADIVHDAAAAILHGFSCQEIGWQKDGAGWRIERIDYREPSWFTVDQATRTQLRFRALGMIDGEPLQQWGWIFHAQKSKSGYLGRGGLVRILAWPYLFKNYSAQDLAEFLRIYGLPTKIGKYPQGATDIEKSTLRNALLSIGHNAAGIMPQSMAVELLQAAQGNVDPFEFMLGYWDRMISKVILGSAMTADFGANGNRSLGDIGNEVRKEIRNSDAAQIAKTLSRDLVFPLGALNGLIRDRTRPPSFLFDTREPEDLKLYAEALPALVAVGLPISVAEIQERLRFRPPEAGEPVLTIATPTPETAPPPVTAATHSDPSPPVAALYGLGELALDGWRPTATIPEIRIELPHPGAQRISRQPDGSLLAEPFSPAESTEH
jgi:phage gp29-like protein